MFLLDCSLFTLQSIDFYNNGVARSLLRRRTIFLAGENIPETTLGSPLGAMGHSMI